MVHNLKTIQPYFGAVWKGKKKFEARLNDRDFKVGDEVYLQEYERDTKTYSGYEVRCIITYILNDYPALQADHIVFGFDMLAKIEKPVHHE